jgi:hypothetical protein
MRILLRPLEMHRQAGRLRNGADELREIRRALPDPPALPPSIAGVPGRVEVIKARVDGIAFGYDRDAEELRKRAPVGEYGKSLYKLGAKLAEAGVIYALDVKRWNRWATARGRKTLWDGVNLTRRQHEIRKLFGNSIKKAAWDGVRDLIGARYPLAAYADKIWKRAKGLASFRANWRVWAATRSRSFAAAKKLDKTLPRKTVMETLRKGARPTALQAGKRLPVASVLLTPMTIPASWRALRDDKYVNRPGFDPGDVEPYADAVEFTGNVATGAGGAMIILGAALTPVAGVGVPIMAAGVALASAGSIVSAAGGITNLALTGWDKSDEAWGGAKKAWRASGSAISNAREKVSGWFN